MDLQKHKILEWYFRNVKKLIWLPLYNINYNHYHVSFCKYFEGVCHVSKSEKNSLYQRATFEVESVNLHWTSLKVKTLGETFCVCLKKGGRTILFSWVKPFVEARARFLFFLHFSKRKKRKTSVNLFCEFPSEVTIH